MTVAVRLGPEIVPLVMGSTGCLCVSVARSDAQGDEGDVKRLTEANASRDGNGLQRLAELKGGGE